MTTPTDLADLAGAGRALSAELERALDRIHGTCQQASWACEDGWVIMYSTTRVNGGPYHDKFVVFAYKPVGRGARTNPSRWEAAYRRGFATRKTAKARAVALYRRHSPRWDAAHPAS